MANEIRMASSVQVLQEVTDGGANYSIMQHDVNVNSKSWGGSYNVGGYENAEVCYWADEIILNDSATAVNTGDCFVGTPDPDNVTAELGGDEPVLAKGIAVEFISKVGTPGDVYITIGATIFAQLDVGEGVFIPTMATSNGLAIANFKLHSNTAYEADVTEAHVNVMLVGASGA